MKKITKKSLIKKIPKKKNLNYLDTIYQSAIDELERNPNKIGDVSLFKNNFLFYGDYSTTLDANLLFKDLNRIEQSSIFFLNLER